MSAAVATAGAAVALALSLAAVVGILHNRRHGVLRDTEHPDDLDTVITSLHKIAPGDSILKRFRMRTSDGSYHWVDGHGKPYIDADGNPDGLIAAVRIVDEPQRSTTSPFGQSP